MNDNRDYITVLKTLDLPNGVKFVKKHVDCDMSSYEAWFVVFPEGGREIEMEISDILAEKFANLMNVVK